ncbi:hypothetical protein ACFVVA_08125 [Kitasatospora sp. NPDC058048]|uniref:hypothetical protein n=1 Tax=Kitasatospora sp. NPDC058048 TaxID=3346313 RepID=UPI0036DA8384
MTGMTPGEGRTRRQGGMGTDDDSDSGLAFLMGFLALGAVVQTAAWLWGHPLAATAAEPAAAFATRQRLHLVDRERLARWGTGQHLYQVLDIDPGPGRHA